MSNVQELIAKLMDQKIVSIGYLELISPSGDREHISLNYSDIKEGDINEAIFSKKFVLNDQAEVGIWRVNSINISDNDGNRIETPYKLRIDDGSNDNQNNNANTKAHHTLSSKQKN